MEGGFNFVQLRPDPIAGRLEPGFLARPKPEERGIPLHSLPRQRLKFNNLSRRTDRLHQMLPIIYVAHAFQVNSH